MMTDVEKTMQKHSRNDAFNSDTPFLQKILEAMDEEERNKMSPERTEEMLRKIKFAASLERVKVHEKERLKNKPIIFEKQKLCMTDEELNSK